MTMKENQKNMKAISDEITVKRLSMIKTMSLPPNLMVNLKKER